jgi:subtilisin family serine protease
MVIAAAGNNGKNLDKNPVYPANYNADNILAIGAMDEEGKPANFSNYGKSVDLYMPGYNIIAITYPENIVTGAGTSQAAAVTSGVFGAAAYLYPACSPLELKNLLLETAFNVGSFTVSRNINLRFLPANKTVYQMNMAKISDIGGVGLITDGHLQSGGCSGNGIGY